MIPFFVLLCIQVGVRGENASVSQQQPVACRTERRMYLLYEQYRADVCARCYNYMPPSAFALKFRYRSWLGVLRDPLTNLTHDADPSNTSRALLESFADDSFVRKWRACCAAAWSCCDRMVREPPTLSESPFCPRTWDGWQCWPDTPNGTTAQQPCAKHVYFQARLPPCTKYASKQCWPNGTWYLTQNYREWTDYSRCAPTDEDRRLLYFHIATYAVSIVSMVPALIIFMAYKQLQVHRITMHKNLLLSLFLNGVVVILLKAIVIADEFKRSDTYDTLMKRNGAGCKILATLTYYFKMTNYMWMFCEGFYLHKLIAAAFAEQKNLVMFYLIGWVLPVVPVGIYAILRKTLQDDNCWAHPAESYEWIMNAPNLLSLVVNLFFLCNIIRVLVTKLRATHANEPSQYRKAVRATLVLVPLFGLHLCLLIYRPQESGHCIFSAIYDYLNRASDGLQGFLVALIFCYLNGEVLYLLRRSYQRYRLHRGFQGPNQASLALNRMSTTQVSSMTESQLNHHAFRYRSKERGPPADGVEDLG